MKRVLLASAFAVFMVAGCSPESTQTASIQNWPDNVMVAPGLDTEDAKQLIETAQTYYAFWNTGDDKLAREALSSQFMDLNLPEGRPQGLEGPIMASAGFRKAVPDLKMQVQKIYVLPETVIGRLHFTGRFTGTFGDLQGQGEAVDFMAVDMYTIKDGKITHNWHLEDNLTLMKQLGVIEK